MTEHEKAMCNGIIHSASLAAGGVGAGLAQTGIGDAVGIGAIQLSMAIALGQVFGITLEQSTAIATVATTAATTVGKTFSAVLFKWIPGFGNTVNAATAFSITEATGWVIANEFAKQSNVTV